MERRESVNKIKDLAYRAPQGISHDPERFGEHLLDSLESELQNFLGKLPEDVHAQYESAYIEKYKEWLGAMSRCFSQMITGAGGWKPATFRRHERTNAAEHSARQRLDEWASKVVKRCNTEHRLRGWDEVERLQHKVDTLTELQERMKSINKVARDKKLTDDEKIDGIVALGLTEENAKELLHPKYSFMGIGFATYQLSNNLAKIKDAQARLDRITSMLGNEDSEEEHSWGTLAWVYSEERVRFLFDDKPDRETISLLKSESFKWSPSNSAWQRQITPACKRAVARIIEQLKGGEE